MSDDWVYAVNNIIIKIINEDTVTYDPDSCIYTYTKNQRYGWIILDRKDPENLYINHIDIIHKKEGLGSLLIFSLLDFFPDFKNLYVESIDCAIPFFKKLGLEQIDKNTLTISYNQLRSKQKMISNHNR
jgi:hypothetical protein